MAEALTVPREMLIALSGGRTSAPSDVSTSRAVMAARRRSGASRTSVTCAVRRRARTVARRAATPAGPIRARRHVLHVGLDLDAPGADGLDGPILDDGGDLADGEAIDRAHDARALAGVSLCREEIGHVELAGPGAHDPDRDAVERAVHQMKTAAQQAQGTDTRLEAIEGRERGAVVIHHTQPTDRDMTAHHAQIDGVRRDGTVGGHAELPDHETASDQGKRDQAGGDQRHERQGGDDPKAETATSHG